MTDQLADDASRLDLAADAKMMPALIGIPAIDFRRNFALATAAGCSMTSMLRDVVTLRFGPGRLTSNEYYYYRLWEPGIPPSAKSQVIGKLAQQAMHLACNQVEWTAAASDKLLFSAIMDGAHLPTPELLAIVHPSRTAPGMRSLQTVDEIATFLRDPDNYPLFAKPIDGKFSLSVLSADRVDGEVMTLRGALARTTALDAARALAAPRQGYLIQRRLPPAREMTLAFGERLWSVRLLVLLTPAGPLLHRATAKIPIGSNLADNYWRVGNLLGALDLSTGRIERAVTGWADTFRLLAQHPDTDVDLIGTVIPRWSDLVELVKSAARILPGIGTQSWDLAIAEDGPVILEVNFGGDLNLSQIASGRGTLDEVFRAHLIRHGYRSMPA